MPKGDNAKKGFQGFQPTNKGKNAPSPALNPIGNVNNSSVTQPSPEDVNDKFRELQETTSVEEYRHANRPNFYDQFVYDTQIDKKGPYFGLSQATYTSRRKRADDYSDEERKANQFRKENRDQIQREIHQETIQKFQKDWEERQSRGALVATVREATFLSQECLDPFGAIITRQKRYRKESEQIAGQEAQMAVDSVVENVEEWSSRASESPEAQAAAAAAAETKQHYNSMKTNMENATYSDMEGAYYRNIAGKHRQEMFESAQKAISLASAAAAAAPTVKQSLAWRDDIEKYQIHMARSQERSRVAESHRSRESDYYVTQNLFQSHVYEALYRGERKPFGRKTS